MLQRQDLGQAAEGELQQTRASILISTVSVTEIPMDMILGVSIAILDVRFTGITVLLIGPIRRAEVWPFLQVWTHRLTAGGNIAALLRFMQKIMWAIFHRVAE